ncbi:hypothetical protein SSPS47_33485 [Streptomyces sp. S4.7]|nr:hypothetical protein SSPS47_33485 [Streptomyces sp. S4.7]
MKGRSRTHGGGLFPCRRALALPPADTCHPGREPRLRPASPCVGARRRTVNLLTARRTSRRPRAVADAVTPGRGETPPSGRSPTRPVPTRHVPKRCARTGLASRVGGGGGRRATLPRASRPERTAAASRPRVGRDVTRAVCGGRVDTPPPAARAARFGRVPAARPGGRGGRPTGTRRPRRDGDTPPDWRREEGFRSPGARGPPTSRVGRRRWVVPPNLPQGLPIAGPART